MECEIGPDQSVSIAIVEAVSATEHCSIESLPPLNETLDPDALDNLVESWNEGTTRQPGHVSFEYSNSLVTVDDHDSISVESPSESTDTA